VSGAREREPARAAALLAALALLQGGAAPSAREVAPCPAPHALPAAPGALVRVRCGAAAGAVPLGGAEGLLFGLPLDLGAADPGALEALPGIGPSRAAAIAREAAERPFCSVAELERVPGIGPVTRRRLAAWVRAGGRARCAP
jgi:hypothetical protein